MLSFHIKHGSCVTSEDAKCLGGKPFSLQPILMRTFGIQDSETNTVSTSQCLQSKSTIILYDQNFLAAWILQRETGINWGGRNVWIP